MFEVTLEQVAQITGGQLVGDPNLKIVGVFTDSREVTPGGIFAAIVGARSDAHNYVDQALASGAVASLVSKSVVGPHVLVTQTVNDIDPVIYAIGRLAQYQRTLMNHVNVVGITGSSGKTSTKDLIGQVLQHHASTVVPAGSANNELGMPLTILNATNDVKNLVLEMGMRGFGHIQYLCEIANPTISVVTNVGHAHIGEVGSQENIAKAKSEIVRDLDSSATAILNADDPFLVVMRDVTKANVVTYGLSESANVRASNVVMHSDGTSEFDVSVEGRSVHISLPLLGQHSIYNALAAVAVAQTIGMDLESIAQALKSATPASVWRMQVKQLPGGIKLINDAYNANPESMAAALRTLVGVADRGHSWAVLGLMAELGEYSQEQHDVLGRLAVRLDVGHLVCVGDEAKIIHLGASQEGSWNGESVWFPDFASASDYIVEKVTSDDVVLFKASRAAHFEELCDLVEQKLMAR